MPPTTDSSPLSDDPRYALAFPTLTEEQTRLLEPFGILKTYEPGKIIWKAGDVDLCMYVVRRGKIKILDGRSGVHLATHDEGSFSGDVDVISGRAAVVSAIAETEVEVLEIPGDCVRAIVSERPRLGDILLRAFLLRRSLLMESRDAGVLIIGSRFSPETLHIREFLARNLYPEVWEDLESDPDTKRMLQEFHIREDETPVVILPSGDLLKAPTTEQLAEALAIKRSADRTFYDLVIIGAGPAGLAAAVYGASEGLSTLVLDASGPGGQAGKSSLIENYMGFPLGLSGQELADGAVVQAEKFGARFLAPVQVRDITCRPVGGHVVVTDSEHVECRCVILAPGARYKKLDVENCDLFDGRGVYYEATHVERVMCSDSNVAVVGGGNSAGQAAVFLSDNAARVFLVVMEKDLREHMSSYLARRIEQTENIEVVLHSQVCEVRGSDRIEGISICDLDGSRRQDKEVAGMFIMIGATPNTEWLPKQIGRDEQGYILTGPDAARLPEWHAHRHPFFLETTCPGVFAAGDARRGSVKRVASAVGEGSMAVTFVHQFLSSVPSQTRARTKN